jgi:hypothetical protein
VAKASTLNRAVKLLTKDPFMSVDEFTKKMKVNSKAYAYILRSKARALIPKADIEVAADNMVAGDAPPTTITLPPQGEAQTVVIPSFLQADEVNHPSHYTVGGIETIDFIEAKGLDYNLGNVVKYVSRADQKGNKLQDLEKARWYLERAISNLV